VCLTLIAVRDFNGSEFSNLNGQVIGQPQECHDHRGLSILQFEFICILGTRLSQGIQRIAPESGAIDHW
jgi:hypothetical protein